MINTIKQDKYHVGDFEGVIVLNDQLVKVNFDAHYRLGDKIDFHLSFEDSSFIGMQIFGLLTQKEPAPIMVKLQGKDPFKVQLLSVANGIVTIQPSEPVRSELENDMKLSRASLKLVNLKFKASLTHHAKRSFTVGEWNLNLEDAPGTDKIEAEAKERNGFAITHELTISRSDCGLFSTVELDSLIEFLRYSVSFLNGGWVSIIDVRGFSADGVMLLQRFGLSLCESWQEKNSWLPEHNIECATEFLNSFYKITSNAPLFESIKKSIYFYVRSNRSSSGPDAGIVLSATALERLWSVICDKENTQMSSKESNNRHPPLSKMIRSAAESCRIPLNIDSGRGLDELRDQLSQIIKDKNERSDLAFAISRIRNDITHHEQKLNPELFNRSVVHAWNEAQWLIEMMILSFVKYSGMYQDRRGFGLFRPTRKVPWV